MTMNRVVTWLFFSKKAIIVSLITLGLNIIEARVLVFSERSELISEIVLVFLLLTLNM